MFKFLLIGDRHNSQNIPKCRKDYFLTTCEVKDNEIIELAKLHDVDAILHPGDFWTDSDRKLKNDFIASVANKWDNIYVNGRKIPLIGIAGNHDLIGENESSLATTTTGLLDALGIFKLTSITSPITFEKDGKKIVITGTNYHKGMDKPEFISDYIIPQHLGDVHIHIVHGMLSPSNLGKLIRHTNIENILDTKADITFCGHDHKGFGIINKDNKFFINPGAVVRLSADQKEITRTVGVVLVTIDSDIQCEFIPLKSALPGNAVIDREELDKASKLEDFTAKLKDSVKSMDIGKGTSLSDIVDNICSEKKIAPSMQASIKAAIDKNVTTKKTAPTAPKGTRITKIHLINFQSHKDTTIELDPHFNVIVGESRQGKSSVLRAIRWVMENKPSGKSFIRTGTEEVAVEITLENGTIIKRFAGKRENGYKIFLPDGKIEEGNTKMVSRVQEIMGYSNFKIDDTTSIPLNILRQGDSWYLIGEKYSSTDRARILGALKDTNAADITIKELDHENSQIQAQIKKDEIELANSELEAEQLQESIQNRQKLLDVISKALIIEQTELFRNDANDFNAKKQIADRIETSFDEKKLSSKMVQLKEMCNRLKAIRKYLGIFSSANEALQHQNSILSRLPDIEATQLQLTKLKEQIKTITKIRALIATTNQQSGFVSDLLKQLKTLESVNLDKLNDLRNNLSKWEKIRDCYLTQRKAERTIAAANKFISASSITDSFTQRRYGLQAKVEHLQKISSLANRSKKEELVLQQKERDFQEADKNMDNAFNSKIEILATAHICPTCYSQLSDESLKELIPKIKQKET